MGFSGVVGRSAGGGGGGVLTGFLSAVSSALMASAVSFPRGFARRRGTASVASPDGHRDPATSDRLVAVYNKSVCIGCAICERPIELEASSDGVSVVGGGAC